MEKVLSFFIKKSFYFLFIFSLRSSSIVLLERLNIIIIVQLETSVASLDSFIIAKIKIKNNKYNKNKLQLQCDYNTLHNLFFYRINTLIPVLLYYRYGTWY